MAPIDADRLIKHLEDEEATYLVCFTCHNYDDCAETCPIDEIVQVIKRFSELYPLGCEDI